jgi:hypothetical protein
MSVNAHTTLFDVQILCVGPCQENSTWIPYVPWYVLGIENQSIMENILPFQILLFGDTCY